MSLRVLRLCVAALAAFVGASAFPGTSVQAQSGTVTGKITDVATGVNVAAAQVQIAGTNFGTVSADDGVYRIVNVPAGTYTVIVRRIGYQEKRTANVVVAPSGTVTVNIAVAEATNTLTSVAVTGTRNRPEKVLDAPAQISVISSERIAERPAVTIADNLRSTVGVDVQQGGIAQSNIVARGFNNAFSGSMLMLQDYRFAGVPSLRVNVPFLFTGTNEDIERIEVLLGPASALYGPNSANGVLHLITKSPFDSKGTTISLDGGERSVLRAGLRHAGGIGEKIAFKLSGEVMRGNDWQYNDRAEPTTFGMFAPPALRGTANDRSFDLERYTGEARVDIRPRDDMELISTIGYTNVASGLELTGANGTSQIKGWTYTNLQQRFRWNRLFAQAFVNMSNAGNDDINSTGGTFLLRSGQPIVDKSSVSAFQVQHGFDMAQNKQSFTYGLDFIATNPETGGTINGQNENIDNVREYGAYIQSTTRPTDKIDLLAALRVDGNNVIDGGFLSPRVALTFKPTSSQNLRATYNRAFSTPANFAFFLDLIQAPNIGGSGYDVRAFGNKPKEGWAFRRGCNGAFGDLCMRSALPGIGDYGNASAARAFGPIFQARGAAVTQGITPGIIGALQQLAGLPAAQAQALGTALGQGIVGHLGSRTPTDAQLGTRVAFLGTAGNLSPSDVRDFAPLEASFNNTYEVGYKGVIGNRATLDVSFWRQQRGDVGTPAALATPSVFFGDQAQLRSYMNSEIGQFVQAFLVSQGFPAANAAALAAGLAGNLSGALSGQFAPAPLGTVTFDGENIAPNVVYATYSSIDQDLWVSGLDLAGSISLSQQYSVDGTYSHMNQNVFESIGGGNGAPLMANSPKNRGTLGVRYENAARAYSFETRARYQESYPVNSGVYATNVAFVIPTGNTGAVPNAVGGFNRCNPAPAGTFCYEDVPEFVTVDMQFSKQFEIGAQRLRWSINAQNILNKQVRTFPGVPEIGRLIMTRVQYSF